MKIEILPAILPKDFSELDENISLVKGLVKTVQIDICDGQFVPNATWPYKRLDDSFEKILREEEGLPGWENVSFEIDLMVNYPERIVEEWVTAGAHRIILHIESGGNIIEAIEKLQGRVEIGLALSMETPLSSLDPYIGKIQSIQLMGIDHIGFQGETFNSKVIDRVKEVHIVYPELPISVDGGVSLETGALLIQAGVTRLIVGSAIFHSDNVIEAVHKFKRLNRDVL